MKTDLLTRFLGGYRDTLRKSRPAIKHGRALKASSSMLRAQKRLGGRIAPMKNRLEGRLGLMDRWRRKMFGINRFVSQSTDDVSFASLMNKHIECLDSSRLHRH